jgi:hypothetical protein
VAVPIAKAGLSSRCVGKIIAILTQIVTAFPRVGTLVVVCVTILFP